MQLETTGLARGSRGQAVFETALFMPLFLLGLFGVLFAVSYSSLSERVQIALRYGGNVSNLANMYGSYSLFGLYSSVDGNNPDNVGSCNNASADDTSLTIGRAVLWRPMSSSVTKSSAGSTTSFTLMNGRTALLESCIMRLSAASPLSGYINTNLFGGSGANGSHDTTTAAENFYRSPSLGTLVGCTVLGTAIKATLEAEQDGITPVTPPTVFPASLPTANVVNQPVACASFPPANELVFQTPPPFVRMTASPAPTCPPGYSGTPPACTSPPPTCPQGTVGTYPNCTTPAPTPTPKPTVPPTPCPTGYTGSPGNCAAPATPKPPTNPPTTPPSPCPPGYLGSPGSCYTPPPATPTPPPATPTPMPTPTPTPTPVPTFDPGHTI